ncbi:hypothetical protein GCM10010329_85110 [Streptomyces spiroverticillatus]|uniref:Uncharacterized protein n=1 Tax=Streptomyces finlayi TaxID=67296 RepID=A0A918X9V3_9ACTN|nr:hypothetical protein GCM10010329_85110 [Streptomyces spiroverticillatus]GHD19547.1 hypothetical protein GCM10010334_83320 [Streptomyces finlayi]
MAGARGCPGGGIVGLFQLLSEHGEAIEADFQRYYQTDIRDAFTPGTGLTWRRVRALLVSLPADSALARSMGGEDAIWTLETQLLAGIHDRLAEGNWQRGNAGAKSPSRRPSPIPRPGVGAGRIGGTERDPQEVAAYLAGLQPATGVVNGR